MDLPFPPTTNRQPLPYIGMRRAIPRMSLQKSFVRTGLFLRKSLIPLIMKWFPCMGGVAFSLRYILYGEAPLIRIPSPSPQARPSMKEKVAGDCRTRTFLSHLPNKLQHDKECPQQPGPIKARLGEQAAAPSWPGVVGRDVFLYNEGSHWPNYSTSCPPGQSY